MIKLSIVTLSYNTKDLTIMCLNSLASQYKDELERKEMEIIVVDNNSSDGSTSQISNLKSQISNLTLIQSKKNLGFAKGCNLGAKNAKGKYILFLNSDTQVLDKGFLSMVEFLNKNPKVAILGGRLQNNDGSVQPSCGKFYTLFNLFIMLLGLERFGLLRSSPSKIQKVDWVSGACMMVKSGVFEKLQGFDEELFMYVEDMEICYRAKKLGLAAYFYPDVRLTHKSLGSSNRTFAIINIYKGILRFYSKHKTYPEYLIAKTLLVAKADILILVGSLTLNKDLRERYKKALS
ncbi:MAG: glycosyltransferase family 2 protein [Candidatus Levybacteria bacterium]|nr:glycosyltransferase family 2 protein [Candidatus Levybacteria bacterium]